MLRVAESYAGTDTGRQRRANEDSMLARSPLFVVADGMGGAQAGEVASRIAIETFQHGLDSSAEPEDAMVALARKANRRIHERSHANASQAGMGTTLTAAYVGEDEVSIAHVGDSRAYCMRDGVLLRLTEDHSLVDELLRQGQLTPEEAVEHPQRSVITRALGPEDDVEVDVRSIRGRAGDVFLLCSDGLTTMLSEEQVASVLRGHADLRDAGEALIAAANDAGGRDNITVLLLRLEEVAVGARPASPPPAGVTGDGDGQREPDSGSAAPAAPADRLASGAGALEGAAPAGRTAAATPEHTAGAAGISAGADASGAGTAARPGRRLQPRQPSANGASRARPRRRLRRVSAALLIIVVLGALASGAYLASQSIYFIGTNNRGLVTIFQGIPYKLPGNIALYSSYYVSGVSASTLSPERRRTLLGHSWRSEANAASLIRSLELGQLE